MATHTEAEIRDQIAAAARHHGWRVSVEWRLRPMEHSWGIVDLMMTKAGEMPVLIECKRAVSTMSTLRLAATQAHAYRTVASRYFVEPCAAYVVADRIPEDETMSWLCVGLLDVHPMATADFIALLERQDSPQHRDALAFEREMASWTGARARCEDVYGLWEGGEVPHSWSVRTHPRLPDPEPEGPSRPGDEVRTKRLYGRALIAK